MLPSRRGAFLLMLVFLPDLFDDEPSSRPRARKHAKGEESEGD